MHNLTIHIGSAKCKHNIAHQVTVVDKRKKGEQHAKFVSFFKSKSKQVSRVPSTAPPPLPIITTPLPTIAVPSNSRNGSSTEMQPLTGLTPLLIRFASMVSKVTNDATSSSGEDQLLQEFGNDPSMYISNPTADCDTIWEDDLNLKLHRVFWARKTVDIEDITYRKGLDAFLHFTHYFICKRGISEGLFELKLELLIEAIKKT